MFSNIGITEFLLIAVVALLLFGPNKLPEVGRALGKTIREFKNSARELMADEKPSSSSQVAPEPQPKPEPQAVPAAEAPVASTGTEQLATFDEQVEQRTAAAEASPEQAGQPVRERKPTLQHGNPKRLPD